MGEPAYIAGPPAGPKDLVMLDRDHPGFRDKAYRQRRNHIAQLALQFEGNSEIPVVQYTGEETQVWTTVWQRLRPVHRRFACAAYLEGFGTLNLDPHHVPQLADVSQKLETFTGFRMLPVAGLVASKAFLSQLARSVFLSTQYVRHASRPLYTPEPDIIHEVIGHAASLCSPQLAALNRLFGEVAARSPESRIEELERLYWFTVEFGVVLEDGKPKAFGAGLLSSFGELGRFATDAFLSPFDPTQVTAKPYDPTDYQKQLYFVPSLDFLLERLRRHFADHF